MKKAQTVWPLALLVLSLATTVLTTQYSNQIIAVMDQNWIEMEVAEFLYNKNPGVSTVVMWNKRDESFVHLKGRQLDVADLDFRTTRLQVVGHGGEKNGQPTLGRLSSSDVAKALNKLYPVDSRATDVNGERINRISRISLVGCNCADASANTPPGDTFAGMLITKLKESQYDIVTSITARTTLVGVDSTGRKLTGTFNDDKTIAWRHKNPAAKKLYTLDDQGNIVVSSNAVADGELITCRACGVRSYGDLSDNDNGITVSVRQNGVQPERVRLTQRALYDILEGTTRNIFGKAAVDANGKPRRTAEVKRYIVRERTSDAVDTEDQVREVREINSLQNFVNEINFFGRTGQQILPDNQPKEFEYYRFGDYVFRMTTDSFYINEVIDGSGYMGVALNEVPADVPEVVPAETKNQLVQESKYRTLTGEQIPRIGERYGEMSGVDNDFFSDMRKYMNGQGGEISVDFDNEASRIAKATNGQRMLAMTLSESIRNFRAHVVNMMSLDLNAHGFLSHQQFFDSHPMARAETWPPDIRDPNYPKPTGFDGSYGGYPWDQVLQTGTLNSRQRRNAKLARTRVSDFLGTWLSNVGQDSIKISIDNGERFVEHYQGTENPTLTIDDVGTDAFNQALSNTIQDSLVNNFRENTVASTALVHNPNSIKFAGPLLASREQQIETPEINVVDLKEENSVNSDSRTLPLVASETLKGDQELIAHRITTHVREEGNQDNTDYSVVQNSVEREENEIRFKVIDKSEPPKEKELSIEVDEEKLGSDDTVDDIKGEIDESDESKSRLFGRGLAIAGTVQGLFGAISALEDGNTKEGVIGLSMAIHGIGELSGINRRIYRSAGKALGNLLSNNVGSLANDVSKDAEFSKAISAGEEEFSSALGREERVFGEDIPFVGIGFGIYNIYQDFSQHTVIGYIDGGIDILITGLDIFGAATGVGEVITEPLTIALTVIRMFIDDFYNSIKQELDSLPPGASVGQKVVAFFKGFGEAILNILEEWTLPGQIFGAISNSHKLNDEYNRDRDLLRNLSNFQNYFKVMKEEGTPAEEINFADGSAAWNGGDITFRLGDSDFAHIQLQEIVDENGKQRTLDVDIPRDSNLQDIVMGIGESHSISFKTVSVKFFFFIPVDTKTIISGLNGDRSSLHGTYYGNSQNNRFFAVQQRPPKLDYQLEDYYYALYGQDGNDTFYLGPQHTYVEGNEGEDTYHISENSTHTDINNFARDRITDYLITTSKFSSLQLSRTGNNLHVTSNDGHNVTIFDWFRGVLYRHMNFRSGDGFLFWITVNEMGEAMTDAYAWTKADSTQLVTLDLSQNGEPYESVITLVGSNFSDVLIGNDKNNQIVGGSGNDVMHGGEGKDTYTIEAINGSNVINNFALDEQQDFLFFSANHDDIDAEVQGDNIRIFKRDNSLSVTLQNWFANSSYQHLLLASNDAVVSQIAINSSNPKILRQLFVDMELLEGPKVLNMSRDEVSVIGSDEPDTIRGNDNDNYFAPGLGDDYIEGGEGPDLYVIRPGEGNDVVYNLALDEQQDTVLFGAKWIDIQLTQENNDLILSMYAKNMSIRLLRWFEGVNFQHLIVRSMDGVVFALPDSSDYLIKTPILIDRGESPAGVKLNIKESPWKNVTRVSGSNFEDAISGNEQSSLMDPGPGRAFLRGRNGHDTYVIKANYSEGNRIYNFAEDEWLDTLLFLVPYSHIVVQKQACSIELSSNLTSGATTVLLVDFMLSSKQQHLMITSSDGVSFVLPDSTDYQPVPLIINLAKESRGQILNLTAETQYTTVRTVYGSTVGSNLLVGNTQNNTLVGGNKPDMLFGNDGNDVLKGGGDNDVLYGGSGNDVLQGGNGNDTLEGGDGDDTLAPGVGHDMVNGGNGTDSVVCVGNPATAEGSYINLAENMTICNSDSSASLTSIEGAYGSAYNDFMIDNAEDNFLVGGGGNDTIMVTEGYDVLKGGPGHDVYDFTNATGTKTIINFATDLKKDAVLMSYANKSSIRYSRSYDNLIVRIAVIGYPKGFFDATKPTVVISKWYQSDRFKHIEFQMNDGIVIQDVIEAYGSQLYAFAFDTNSNGLLPQ